MAQSTPIQVKTSLTPAVRRVDWTSPHPHCWTASHLYRSACHHWPNYNPSSTLPQYATKVVRSLVLVVLRSLTRLYTCLWLGFGWKIWVLNCWWDRLWSILPHLFVHSLVRRAAPTTWLHLLFMAHRRVHSYLGTRLACRQWQVSSLQRCRSGACPAQRAW